MTGSGTKIIRTILPVAPTEYDQNFVNQLARNLDRVIDEQRQPLLNIQNMPTDAIANTLQTGDLYNANGFVKIKQINDVDTGSQIVSTFVGTVTVSTP
tara:strand:+ start:3288 stop:3581 length:294 start_codon:yes stop_codon:yes gene_type:complete